MKRFFGFATHACIVVGSSFRRKEFTERYHHRPVKVGSTQFPAGDYKVSWTANRLERSSHHRGKGGSFGHGSGKDC